MIESRIYLNQDTGELSYKKDEQYYPVKTLTSFDPDSIFVNRDGQLIFKNFDGNNIIIKDTAGNPVQVDYKDEIASIRSHYQTSSDLNLLTQSKHIVPAINEIYNNTVSLINQTFSHTYTIGEHTFAYKKYLSQVSAGVYKIVADVQVGVEYPVEGLSGACIVTFAINYPQKDPKVYNFGEEFQLSENEDVFIAFASKDFMLHQLEQTDPTFFDVPYKYSINVSNLTLVPVTKSPKFNVRNGEFEVTTFDSEGKPQTNKYDIGGHNGNSLFATKDDNGRLVVTTKDDAGQVINSLTFDVKGEKGDSTDAQIDLDGNLIVRTIKADGTVNIKTSKVRGENGISYVPSVDSDGELSWSESTSPSVSVPKKVNIKGPKGEDGLGFKSAFPANPKLGDTFTWGGDSGLNNNCFLGYVMTGQQYVYSQLPSKLGVSFMNDLFEDQVSLIPMHIMLYIPDLLKTGMVAATQFNKTEQIHPLRFNNNTLVTSVTTITPNAGMEYKVMSWAVSYGLTDSQIKDLQPYIINIAKSIFDSKVSEYTTSYASPYTLPKYLQGSAMKCKYSDFLTEDTIFNKLFTFLQENPSNIFTGLQQAIADKLAGNNIDDLDVYIIPIQAVPDTSLDKSWISEMPELTEGWAPLDSALHNGFNTNQVGIIQIAKDLGGGDMELQNEQ